MAKIKQLAGIIETDCCIHCALLAVGDPVPISPPVDLENRGRWLMCVYIQGNCMRHARPEASVPAGDWNSLIQDLMTRKDDRRPLGACRAAVIGTRAASSVRNVHVHRTFLLCCHCFLFRDIMS